MDLAVFVQDARDLDGAAEAIGGVAPTRLYFGNEFCERLLALEAQLDLAIDAAAARGLGFSLVLPYLTPQPFARAVKLLERLAVRAPGAEVVANDWGVLRKVASMPALVPVMGRCLNRTLRDPRLPEHVGGALPPGALAALRGGPFASEAFRAFAAKYRVARVEHDEPPLGIDPSARAEGLAASIHYPYAFVASGRVCLFAAVGRDDDTTGERFTPGPCKYECRDYTLRLEAPADLGGRFPILQRGNTVFLLHEQRDVPALLARLAPHADRLVWSREAPMGGGPWS